MGPASPRPRESAAAFRYPDQWPGLDEQEHGLIACVHMLLDLPGYGGVSASTYATTGPLHGLLPQGPRGCAAEQRPVSKKHGPVGAATDEDLVGHIHRVLAESPFHGEGYPAGMAIRHDHGSNYLSDDSNRGVVRGGPCNVGRDEVDEIIDFDPEVPPSE